MSGRVPKSGQWITYSGYQVSSGTVGPINAISLIPFDVVEDIIIKKIGSYVTALTTGVGFTAYIQFGIYFFDHGEFDENTILLGEAKYNLYSAVLPIVANPAFASPLHISKGSYLLGIGFQQTITSYTVRALNTFKVNHLPFFSLASSTSTVETTYYTLATGFIGDQYLPANLKLSSLSVLTRQTGTSIPSVSVELN